MKINKYSDYYSGPSGKFHCPECSGMFETGKGLASHLRGKHPEAYERITGRKLKPRKKYKQRSQKAVVHHQFGEMPIDKDVPLHGGKRGKSLINLEQMSVSDSFFIPTRSSDEKKMARSVINSCHHWGKRNKKSFSAREVDGGYRVWRIE